MNTLKANRCSILISKYKKSNKVTERNSIYELMRTDIIKYLKSASKKPFTESEVLSMSWDVFLLCLDEFSEEENFANTLVNSVRSVVSGAYYQIKRKNKNEKNIGYGEYPENEYAESILIRDSLIALKDFRSSLPRGYRIIFDDCIASFGEDTRNHQSRVFLSKIPSHRYYEAKKLMKWFAQYILGKKGKFVNEKEKKAKYSS